MPACFKSNFNETTLVAEGNRIGSQLHTSPLYQRGQESSTSLEHFVLLKKPLNNLTRKEKRCEIPVLNW